MAVFPACGGYESSMFFFWAQAQAQNKGRYMMTIIISRTSPKMPVKRRQRETLIERWAPARGWHAATEQGE